MRRMHRLSNLTGRGAPLGLFAVLACIMAIVPVVPAVGSPATTKTDVTFHGDGGLLLHGIIVAPASAGRHPGLVMIGGSGPTTTNDFRYEAAAFARHGIVTLIYDKRRVGYSPFHRNYAVLANDAIGGVSLLRAQSNVDPSLIGVFGLSEGAWVAPLAATRTNAIAFVVTVGAAGGTPAEQIAWQYREWLHHAGVTASLQHMMQTATKVGVALGLIAEANFDGKSVWEKVHQPVLALWGEFDRHDAPAASSRAIARALERAQNTHYTIRFVANAQHDLHITHDRGYDNLQELAPGYASTVGSWVNDLSRGLPSVRVGAAPRPDVKNIPLTPLRWYDSSWVLITVFVSMLLLFGSYPFVAIWRRLSRRTSAAMLRWPMRWLAACGFVTVVGFFVYFGFLVSTAASNVGDVILGNPIPWLALRLIAVGAIASAIWTAVRWYRYRSEVRAGQVQIGLMLTAGVFLLAWSAFWGMLIV